MRTQRHSPASIVDDDDDVSYYYDTGEANDVESGLGYWSSQTNHTLTDLIVKYT